MNSTCRAEEYFLSQDNAAATRDQKIIEETALHILKSSEMIVAQEQVRFMWRAIVGADPDTKSWDRFEASIVEYSFNYALKAANCDANYPRITSALYCAPHEWFEMHVPGSRLAGDNPDNQYILIPIDSKAHFELIGQTASPPPGDVNMTLMGNTGLSKTLGSIEGRDLEIGPDGKFLVTISPDSAMDRKNHLQTRPGTLFLFIRESRSDWRQGVSRLRICRLDPPTAPAMDFSAMAARAAEMLIDDVPGTYWWMRLCHALVPNTMSKPYQTVKVGGLFSQQVSFGHLFLAADEAFIITVEPGGAGFRNLVLHDYWYISLDVANNQSCMNNGQAVADADGKYTYIVSHEDPGIHNWLNPLGLNELLLVHRWQKLPREAAARGPAIHGQLVRRDQLDSILWQGVRRIEPEARLAQLADRAMQFALRFRDG